MERYCQRLRQKVEVEALESGHQFVTCGAEAGGKCYLKYMERKKKKPEICPVINNQETESRAKIYRLEWK